MKRLTMFGAAAIVATCAAGLYAQTKTVTGETVTVTATVEAIDQSTRTVTVKKDDGTFEDVYVPMEMKKFDTLKIGDRITARYYENIVLRVQKPGDKPVDTSETSATPREAGKAGGTISHQRTITATITAIDMKAPSITFSGPHNWKYSSRVKDTKMLAQVKVGDKVEITWTEAALISLDPAKPPSNK